RPERAKRSPASSTPSLVACLLPTFARGDQQRRRRVSRSFKLASPQPLTPALSTPATARTGRRPRGPRGRGQRGPSAPSAHPLQAPITLVACLSLLSPAAAIPAGVG